MTRKNKKKKPVKAVPEFDVQSWAEQKKRIDDDRKQTLVSFAEKVKYDYPEVYEKWLNDRDAALPQTRSLAFPRQGTHERNLNAEGMAQVRLKISQRMKIVQEALAAGKMEVEWGSISDSMQASELKVLLSGDIFGQLVHAFIVIDQKTADALRRG